MIVAHIEATNTVAAHEAAVPLRKLIVAISDLLRGGTADLFVVQRAGSSGGEGGPVGRPKDKSHSLLQGAVAAAMEVLMGAPDMTRRAAAVYVANKAAKHGLKDHENKTISWTQVASWRDRAGGDLPGAASDVFKRIANSEPRDTDQAKKFADGILLAAALTGLATDKDSEEPHL